MSKIVRINKSVVEQAQPPQGKDQDFYRDDQLKGFALRVTASGVKSFVVETLINNKVRRITIGKYGKLTAEQARKEAMSLLGRIARGENPIAEKKMQKVKAITLQQAFDDYLQARKSLKQTTIADYRRVLQQVMPDWLNKPIASINRDMVAKRHAKFGDSNSKARANLCMRLLRAIFNFAIYQYQTDDGGSVISINPVKFLSHARSWYRIERKQTIVKQHQLADWYKGVAALSELYPHEQAALWQDYFMLILLTGLRRTEAASLRWENVDLRGKIITLLDTKNRGTHVLPMSDYLAELFERRSQHVQSEYVFPSVLGSGHIVEPRKTMLKVVEISGVDFTLHDLRRTFITTAESLDISVYSLKRLLNHKNSNDVTAGYLVIDVERLRKPMQLITDFILKSTQIIASCEVFSVSKSLDKYSGKRREHV
ncbi:MAG: integrase [Gammaproteobacteria bacterium RIFCSPHIGHO2_12_FULL_45_12]|nr:MAG: integrase [Gammaproteobacteria bacterium RIFCSPHIGHO2_12_FULL_45_12]